MLTCPFVDRKGAKANLIIDGRTLIFEFLPINFSTHEIKQAADRRDRFNLLISMYLSSVIKNKLFYDEILESEFPFQSPPNPKSFKIVLKFKNPITLSLMDKMIGKDSLISFCDLGKFIQEQSYHHLVDEYQKYLIVSNPTLKTQTSMQQLGIYGTLEKVYKHAAMLQERSKELLWLNIWSKQQTLIFASLNDQKFVIDHLYESDHQDKNLYDDIFLSNNGFSSFAEGIQYSSLYSSKDNNQQLFIPISPEKETKESLMNLIAKKFSR